MRPSYLYALFLLMTFSTQQAVSGMINDHTRNRSRLLTLFLSSPQAFRANRLRLLATFNTLAYRGPSYEVNIQYVIKDMVRIFPGLSSYSVRTLLNVLQITNT